MSELLPRKERGIDRGRNKDGMVPGMVRYGGGASLHSILLILDEKDGYILLLKYEMNLIL